MKILYTVKCYDVHCTGTYVTLRVLKTRISIAVITVMIDDVMTCDDVLRSTE